MSFHPYFSLCQNDNAILALPILKLKILKPYRPHLKTTYYGSKPRRTSHFRGGSEKRVAFFQSRGFDIKEIFRKREDFNLSGVLQ